MDGRKREMAGAQEPSGRIEEFSGAAGAIWENGGI